MGFRKKRLLTATIALIAVVILTSAYALSRLPNSEPSQTEATLFQVSAYYPMSLGDYEGTLTYAELESHGDFGIGAFNGMDGEMVALDDSFYQVRTDGVPRVVDPSLKSPFAMLTFFSVDQTVHMVDALNYSQLTVYIDSILPSQNGVYAIKVHGNFEYAKARSVPVQSKPYPALAEVVKNQTVFPLSNVLGTAVGYRCPSYMNGTDVPGYHLHFLTDSRDAGGHLLDCIVRNATIEIAYIDNFEMALSVG